MKKTIAIVLCLLLVCLTGCSTASKNDKITVVAAIFPEYDWARQIIGKNSNIELTLLVDDGVDPHSFQPSVGDMVAVANCDLLIYGGGESDGWLADALKGSKQEQTVLELIPLLGEKAHTEQIVEGMQAEAEEEAETDEHVWLSLRNAAVFCRAIADALCRLDPANKDSYQANLEDYLARLNALDERYTRTIANARRDTIVVCDRFPFRYLVEDYNLRYYAAFPGCSAECNASFETVIFLAQKVQELGLPAILVTETTDGRIARSVAENAGQESIDILTLDAMQSVSLKDAASRDYLATMEQNLQVLETALN